MKKRYWLAILCAALVLAVLLPFTMRTANAEVETSGQCGDNLYWEFDESTGTLTFTGSGDMYDYPIGSHRPWESVQGAATAISLPIAAMRFSMRVLIWLARLRVMRNFSAVSSIVCRSCT